MATYYWMEPTRDVHELVHLWHPDRPVVRITRSDGGWCSNIVGLPHHTGLLSWGKNLDEIKRKAVNTIELLMSSGQVQ